MAYIDTKYLFKCETCRHFRSGECDTWCENGECYSPLVSEIPIADVEEVKHGEWKVEFHNGKKFIICSVCDSVIDCYTTYIDENEYDGCPYCRAKMDGGKAE